MPTEVQLFFTELWKNFPFMSKYHSAEAGIVTHKRLQKVLMKTNDWREPNLNDEECKYVRSHQLEIENSHQ